MQDVLKNAFDHIYKGKEVTFILLYTFFVKKSR